MKPLTHKILHKYSSDNNNNSAPQISSRNAKQHEFSPKYLRLGNQNLSDKQNDSDTQRNQTKDEADPEMVHCKHLRSDFFVNVLEVV